MLQGISTIENSSKDDYSNLLHAFIWGDDAIRQSVVPDMDRAIEKSTKIIKTHSMEIKGHQKNKYVIMSYMLIGKARFYKGDYFPALETFNYVIDNFGKTKVGKPLALEANLWAGWCQLQIGNTYSAENYLNEVYRNKNLDKNLGDDVAAALAQKYIQEKNYEEAYTKLREAVLKSDVKGEKIRWIFMLGQLQEILGNRYEASSHFKKVVNLKPADYDLLFTAQLRRALNFDVYMESSSVIYNELERMMKDDKNIDLKDQIYYVMALIALEEEDYVRAEMYLDESVKASSNNKTQKGLSYTKHAEISFKFKNYIEAQAYYDSAYVLLPPAHEKYPEVMIRKESLTELVANIKTINLQDSLQRLSNMSLARQTQIIDDYIEWLKEEDERIAEEKELLALNAQLAAESQGQGSGPNVGGGGGWYFYNSNARASGLATFGKIWGTRKLEDNWRQSNKTIRMVSNNDDNEGDSATAAAGMNRNPKGNQKYDREFYLAQIPETPEQIVASDKLILDAYISLGEIYYEKLDDWQESTLAYEKSISRFPDNEYEPRTLYTLYRIFTNYNKEPQAEEVKNTLISKYPKSPYAMLLSNAGGKEEKDENYIAAEKKYEACYQLFSAGNYRKCLPAIAKAKKSLSENPLEAKFDLLAALCYGKQKKKDKMEAALLAVTADFMGTPEAILAQSLLNQMGGLAQNNEIINKSPYQKNAKQKHRFIIITKAQGVNMNDIRNKIADYNKDFHKFEKIQVKNIFLDGEHQMLMVTNLENQGKAEKYIKGFLQNKEIMGYLPPSAEMFVISEDNFKVFYVKKDIQEYLKFYQAVYQVKK